MGAIPPTCWAQLREGRGDDSIGKQRPGCSYTRVLYTVVRVQLRPAVHLLMVFVSQISLSSVPCQDYTQRVQCSNHGRGGGAEEREIGGMRLLLIPNVCSSSTIVSNLVSLAVLPPPRVGPHSAPIGCGGVGSRDAAAVLPANGINRRRIICYFRPNGRITWFPGCSFSQVAFH